MNVFFRSVQTTRAAVPRRFAAVPVRGRAMRRRLNRNTSIKPPSVLQQLRDNAAMLNTLLGIVVVAVSRQPPATVASIGLDTSTYHL